MTAAIEPEPIWEVAPGPMTRAERDAWPDDGRRHELIDGMLVVTPAPSFGHQRMLARLFAALEASMPDELEVMFAPLDVELAEDTVVEPDLLVAPYADFDERGLPKPPLLAVEALSPSTRRLDLTLKKARYEAAGTPFYWVLDPDAPSVTTWELCDGAYVLVGSVFGDEVLEVMRPFPVTLVPNRLVARRRGR